MCWESCRLQEFAGFRWSLRIVILVMFVLIGGDATWSQEISFNQDIRPILVKNCFACHGFDSASRQADLRLDQREAALKADAFVPGNAGDSEFVSRIESKDADHKMPPPDSGHSLTSVEVSLLRRWVDEGAVYESHWSFSVPGKMELPKPKPDDWAQTPIDQFVFEKLRAKQLSPSPDADRYRWIRRVSLALTGLPPTPEEADAFAADESAGAYGKVVDRLLASDAYGEHWARMWLDLARYADTKGYEKDRHRDMWRYRDWVIDAFNADMPFDQFTMEQLAGDLLPDRTTDQILATAFHRNTMTNEEGGTDNEEFRVAAVKDRVDTTTQVWMGLTMGCAKCHTHKYDPISQTDYYSFYSLFNQTKDNDTEGPHWPTPTSSQTAEIEDTKREIKKLESMVDSAAEALNAAKERLKKLNAAVPKTPVMQELEHSKYRTTKIHNRGNFLDQGDEVAPAILKQFGSLPDDIPLDRRAVARWLTQPQNPLTARVMANRVWARLFGVGIVETEEDFGSQGTPPTHPVLLDWLAVEFQENGWSMKKLLRTIVLSKTFRQSSSVTPDQIARDPRNRWLSRGPRFRLSAEAVRDQALAVSGLLTQKIGGPSVMPPQPGGIWKSTYSGESWKNAVGPDRYRRGLYTYLKRTSPYPAMTTFDAGSGEVCQVRRVRTNTPLQALVTLNDTAFLEAAGALSQRMAAAGNSLESQIRRGFRLVLIRPAEPFEVERLSTLYQQVKPQLDDQLLASAGLEEGDVGLVALASVLLNLDETLMMP